jgi:orotidine-5'-phosphate decarboxylase
LNRKDAEDAKKGLKVSPGFRSGYAEQVFFAAFASSRFRLFRGIKMTREEAVKKIIFAMDVKEFSDVQWWAEQLSGHVGMFKVGKQLYTACGPASVRMIQKCGGEVFLDLKYHDIPNTVAMAALEAANLGVQLCDLHAMGGLEMMSTTMETLDKNFSGCNPRPRVLAITVLTSSNEETLRGIGINIPVPEMVVKLAKLAQAAGVDGVVASPQEVELIREACGRDFLVVTPGVRPSFAATNDQKRIMTPADAIKAGADYLVIGRPIAQAKDPVQAAQAIVDEIVAG